MRTKSLQVHSLAPLKVEVGHRAAKSKVWPTATQFDIIQRSLTLVNVNTGHIWTTTCREKLTYRDQMFISLVSQLQDKAEEVYWTNLTLTDWPIVTSEWGCNLGNIFLVLLRNTPTPFLLYRSCTNSVSPTADSSPSPVPNHNPKKPWTRSKGVVVVNGLKPEGQTRKSWSTRDIPFTVGYKPLIFIFSPDLGGPG